MVEIRPLGADRVGATVEIALPSGEGRTDYALLTEQDGGFLIEGLVEGIAA